MPTIGVAIAVPEPYASELQTHRAMFGDPLALAIPSHITLVPPTEVVDNLDRVLDHLALVAQRHQAFGLRLRGTATFRPVSAVVFVAVTEGISACEMLAHDVRQGPLGQKLEYPYHPHVTVAHHLDESALDEAYDALADYDCAFDVDAFSLYIHGDDGVWRPEATFALRRARASIEV
ncbi:MAG TPA: 2'-5' RNA ligase family protein [Nocardioidaceae bacterium]|nr:2'-5' RNA ligase family protein [Nocardioidaceae bacterium]